MNRHLFVVVIISISILLFVDGHRYASLIIAFGGAAFVVGERALRVRHPGRFDTRR